MSLLVVGTVAFDSVATPHGRVERVLGGSATYFSFAASFFTPVRLVSVVGEDFPDEFMAALRQRRVDLAGLARVPGRTFSWCGSYEGTMNEARTLDVQLNVYGDFSPALPEAFRDSRYVFLANGSPDSQMRVLEQVREPRLVVADTMNLWIERTPDGLRKLLERIDALVLNEGEARMLSGEPNLIAAGERILAFGPRAVIVKKGEHGSLLFSRDGGRCALPAFPVARVVDPTGAGDSFAGGMMGFLARNDLNDAAALRRAMVFGTVMSSFVVEDFSLAPFQRIGEAEIWSRYHDFIRFITV
ncbi:MAG: sugar kinase [Planctomycetes bacterium]|nr:sugar kinase [Planctomycetota bacterium]